MSLEKNILKYSKKILKKHSQKLNENYKNILAFLIFINIKLDLTNKKKLTKDTIFSISSKLNVDSLLKDINKRLNSINKKPCNWMKYICTKQEKSISTKLNELIDLYVKAIYFYNQIDNFFIFFSKKFNLDNYKEDRNNYMMYSTYITDFYHKTQDIFQQEQNEIGRFIRFIKREVYVKNW